MDAGALHDRLERVANLLAAQARATGRAHGVEPMQRPDPEDGRRIHLVLTREGEQVVREAFPPQLLRASIVAEDEALTAGLEQLLRRMQQTAGAASFGVCRSCAHFRQEGERRFRCRLTGEPLRRPDIGKICLEHDASGGDFPDTEGAGG